jgi:hypothetical protein
MLSKEGWYISPKAGSICHVIHEEIMQVMCKEHMLIKYQLYIYH